jgi:hypothetical protein
MSHRCVTKGWTMENMSWIYLDDLDDLDDMDDVDDLDDLDDLDDVDVRVVPQF